jgi:hypothetical protein
MLVQELRAEFGPYFSGAPAWLILWLDKTGEWDGVVDHLKGEFELLRYRGSLMELKAAVEFAWQEGKKPKFVLYVPRVKRESLGVLKEYEFLGRVFDATILAKLREWGMEIDREAAQAIEPMLPILAREYSTSSRQVWQDILKNPLKYLVSQFDILEFLADPVRKSNDLKKRDKWDFFQAYVSQLYGGPSISEAAPETWVVDFTTYLILTEAFYRNGRRPDFPSFKIRPAEEHFHRACLDLLDLWINHATFKDDFKKLSKRAESHYDLSHWADALPAAPRSEASVKVAQKWASKTLARVEDISDVDALRSMLEEERTVIDKMAKQFRSREGDVLVWSALQAAAKVVEEVGRIENELSQCSDPRDYAQRYTETWWELDRDYRKLRAGFDGYPDLQGLISILKNAYSGVVRKMNTAFTEAVSRTGHVELGFPPQADFWSTCIAEVKGLRAILFVDAMRYEMGKELSARLAQIDGDVQVESVVAALPTVTPVGMSMLCPGNVTLSVEPGGWRIVSDVLPKENLARRDARKNVIRRKHPKTKFFDLEDLLKVEKQDLGGTNLAIGFSKEWDDEAHPLGALTLSMGVIDSYLNLLARVVQRLGALGVEKVWIVTDHGFLIVEDLAPADEMHIPTQPAPLMAGYRFLVADREVSMPGVLFLDLPRSQGLKVGVPSGFGVFMPRTDRTYFHGGLSLQEAVLPVVSVKFARAEVKYGVVLQVEERITNLIFPVHLLRTDPAGHLFLSPRLVFITGVLIPQNKEIEQKVVIRTDASPVEIDKNKTVHELRLRVAKDTVFSKGDKLLITVLDAQTEEDLAQQEVTIDVESNF